MRPVLWRRSVGRRAAVAGVLAATLGLSAGAQAGVQNVSPYWFEDTYQGLAFVDAAKTSAIVDTAGDGTAWLPPLSPDDLAYAPPSVGADILEVGTASGVQGWGFNGAGMVRQPFLDVAVAQPVGVAFLGAVPKGVPSEGVRLAVGTASGASLYGWNGAGWALAVTIADPGIVGVAPGAEAGVVAATASGFVLYSPAGVQLTQVTGLSGLRGVAATDDGALVAVWTATTAAVYAWTGAQDVPLPAWSELTPTGGTLLGLAFFRGGNGYWLATPTGAVAYGWNGVALTPLPEWDASAMPATPVAIATGWDQGALAVLSPDGAGYLDAAGGALGVDAAKTITGQAWPVFAPTGQVQSSVLAVGHACDEVRMVDTMAALPPSGALTYALSTNGGGAWTAVPPLLPTALPAGDSLVYRALLSTADQAVTPVLNTTDLYEIATVVTYETQAVSWLIA